MSCKCAIFNLESVRMRCSITGDDCMYYWPDGKRCAEEYGDGPGLLKGNYERDNLKFRIYFKVKDVQDSIIIEGETIEEIRLKVISEIIEKRSGNPLWSERVGD